MCRTNKNTKIQLQLNRKQRTRRLAVAHICRPCCCWAERGRVGQPRSDVHKKIVCCQGEPCDIAAMRRERWPKCTCVATARSLAGPGRQAKASPCTQLRGLARWLAQRAAHIPACGLGIQEDRANKRCAPRTAPPTNISKDQSPLSPDAHTQDIKNACVHTSPHLHLPSGHARQRSLPHLERHTGTRPRVRPSPSCSSAPPSATAMGNAQTQAQPHATLPAGMSAAFYLTSAAAPKMVARHECVCCAPGAISA